MIVGKNHWCVKWNDFIDFVCRSCVALKDPYCSWFKDECRDSHLGLVYVFLRFILSGLFCPYFVRTVGAFFFMRENSVLIPLPITCWWMFALCIAISSPDYIKSRLYWVPQQFAAFPAWIIAPDQRCFVFLFKLLTKSESVRYRYNSLQFNCNVFRFFFSKRVAC